MESQARDAHNVIKHQAEFEGVPLPPRARARLARMQAEAKQHAESTLASTQQRQANARYLTSTQQAAFTRHDDKCYADASGARIMKTQEGKPLPASARDVDFAVSCGWMPPRATIADPAALGASLAPEGATGTLDTTRGAGGPAAAGDAPVTVYSQRLAEGVFPASEAANKANPFARSAAFTNDLGDPTIGHADAPDKPTGIRKLGSSMALAPGAGLGVGQVLDRVRLALTRRYGSASLGSEALADALEQSARVAAGGRPLDPSGSISLDILRQGLKRLGVPLPERELSALYLFFDVDGSGAVSREELLAGLRGDLDAELGVTAAMTSARSPDAGGRTIGASSMAGSAETASGTTGAARTSHLADGTPTALLHVHFVDGREERIRVADPIGMGEDDVPAMKARLRREGVTGVHSVSLVKE